MILNDAADLRLGQSLVNGVPAESHVIRKDGRERRGRRKVREEDKGGTNEESDIHATHHRPRGFVSAACEPGNE